MVPLPRDAFLKNMLPVSSKRLGKNQEAILLFLSEHNEAYTAKEIQRCVGIDYIGATTASLKALFSRGLIERRIVSGKTYWKGDKDAIVEYLRRNENGEEDSEGEQRDQTHGSIKGDGGARDIQD